VGCAVTHVMHIFLLEAEGCNSPCEVRVTAKGKGGHTATLSLE
jgi:hypothetical protein